MKLASLCLSLLIASALCAANDRVAAQSNSTDVVADINGQILRYGSNNTFDIKIYNVPAIWVYGFYFGLGDPQDMVKTNTPLSLSVFGPSPLVVCQNGTGDSGFEGSTPPQDGLFIIRENTTFGFYTLHLANSSTTGIQFGLNTKAIFACTPNNASSTPIQFIYDVRAPSPSSSSHCLSPFLPLLYTLAIFLVLVFCSPFSF